MNADIVTTFLLVIISGFLFALIYGLDRVVRVLNEIKRSQVSQDRLSATLRWILVDYEDFKEELQENHRLLKEHRDYHKRKNNWLRGIEHRLAIDRIESKRSFTGGEAFNTYEDLVDSIEFHTRMEKKFFDAWESGDLGYDEEGDDE